MPNAKLTLAALLAVAALGVTANAETPAVAQDAAKPVAASASAVDGGEPGWIKPETPQERLKRIATTEDPGTDPDRTKHYIRFGKSYHIEKFDRRTAVYDQAEGWVRPLSVTFVTGEIYQQNAKWVWVWFEDPAAQTAENATPSSHSATAGMNVSRYTEDEIRFLKKIRDEWRVIDPAPSGKQIKFEESSTGLPVEGSWRNTVAVADMNGDGFADLIAPAQRGGSSTGVPTIFLGDGKGHWTPWAAAKWPHGIDYGGVAAADFNKDGHMDLVFAVHLNGVYVFLGDGKGTFTEVIDGLSHDFATRRVRVADVDRDGWPDIVVINEGPSALGATTGGKGPIRAFLNRKKGTSFESINIAPSGTHVGGDYLVAGDFNGDKTLDFAAGNNHWNGWDVLFLSKGKTWEPYSGNDGNRVPSLSYYFGNTAGHFTSTTRDDVVMSYARTWPPELQSTIPESPKTSQFTAIDIFSIDKTGAVVRKPIVRWEEGEDLRGIGSGDFDGDGNLDIVYTHVHPREAVVLLGDGKGSFKKAATVGLTMPEQTNYDLTVADVNGDGRPDVILSFEATDSRNVFAKKDGSVRVFLNRGASAAAPAVVAPAAAK